MKRRRFKHETCKLRITTDDSDITSALTPTEYIKLLAISDEMGISLTHVVSSLIKKSLSTVETDEQPVADAKPEQ